MITLRFPMLISRLCHNSLKYAGSTKPLPSQVENILRSKMLVKADHELTHNKQIGSFFKLNKLVLFMLPGLAIPYLMIVDKKGRKKKQA